MFVVEDILPEGGFISKLPKDWQPRDERMQRLLFTVDHQNQKIFIKAVTAKIKREVFNSTFVPRIRVLLNLDHWNVTKYCGLALAEPVYCNENHLCHLTASLYYAGNDLRAWTKNNLKDTGVISPEHIKQFLCHVLTGLHYLHVQCKHKIFHCDIKPQNLIVVHADQRVVIIDFEGAAVNGELSHETENNCYTPIYAAPELLHCTALAPNEEAEVCGKTDIWSVGCVAIYLATGEEPVICEWKGSTGPGTHEWENYSYGKKYTYHTSAVVSVGGRKGKPQLPELSSAEGDQNLLNFIKSCLMFDPEQRKSAAELLHDAYLKSAAPEFCPKFMDNSMCAILSEGKERQRLESF
ncbi:uncharacterized protein LOC129594536 [Paramacrobiotus metropolitanus]|uniref:uncharacterized protein LOC129594536 n=1 Tax=Paramacrobiotus metropolitanus TaxID=2943436 RepID=UPI0024458146|nr:uncharacterized protein LOC129594536 [Paramacrobiotus metropolitanus]XP_055347227.1 uncharacterized protein LOC129594536 [Paramacrobiotus metropolitanus]XP_055347228.1 uncharacterized protein LOC129594536 [Paramacrobiotus metropolitanus]